MGWSLDGHSPLVAVTPARPASPCRAAPLVGTALWWPSPPPGRLPRAGQLPCELLALCVLAAPERLLHVDVRTSRMSVPSAASREQ